MGVPARWIAETKLNKVEVELLEVRQRRCLENLITHLNTHYTIQKSTAYRNWKTAMTIYSIKRRFTLALERTTYGKLHKAFEMWKGYEPPEDYVQLKAVSAIE